MDLNLKKNLGRLPFFGFGYTAILGFMAAFFSGLVCFEYLKNQPENLLLDAADPVLKEEELFSDDEFKKIVARNVFNKEGELPTEDTEPKKKGLEKDAIKKTDLSLKLLGTLWSGDRFSGIAVIEEQKEKKIETFLVGDYLIGDAKLAEVYQNKIIIDRGDYKEFLEIEQPEINRNPRHITQAKEKEASSEEEGALDNYKEEGFERVGNNIQVSSEFKQQLLSTQFARILQDVKAVPHMEGDQLKGYRLTKLKEDSIYEKMGLQTDDIIREINGFVLDDASQVLKYLQSLKAEKKFDVEFIRNGVSQVIHVQVQ
jgi:type II secretion system protein C